MEELGKPIETELEELLRSCPRCGKASANKSNPAGRCRSCLKKLAANKKKPGHYLHNHKIADDAIRRQEGRNGSSPKKKSGHGTRKQIIDKVKSEEKKTGQVVSLDRKDNKKGYTPSNVRGVDPKLNRGRHKVDSKKLAAWRKRLKKHNLELDEFMTLLRAKALQKGDEQLEKTLQLLDIEKILEKVKWDDESQRWHVEMHDKPGTPHPTDKDRISSFSERGMPSWGPTEEVGDKYDNRLVRAHAKFIKKSGLSEKGVGHFNELFRQIINDPDRHLERTDSRDASKGMRARHLQHLMSGNPHYSMHETDDGIIIRAQRHIRDTAIHEWHFGDKGLRFLGKKDLKKTDESQDT